VKRRVWGAWFSLIVFLALVAFWHKPLMRIYFILEYPAEINTACRENNLDPALVSALIFVESRFDPRAESSKGALGLMQIMPETGGWIACQTGQPGFQPADLLEPTTNLAVGSWYLAYLKHQFNEADYPALAAYNAGAANVSEWLKKGVWDGSVETVEQVPFSETREYLKQLVWLARVYRYLYSEQLGTEG
jgi:soluble lytic murein transglycosylase